MRRIPVIPLIVVIILAGGGVGLLLLSDPPDRVPGVPVASALVDVEGIETEVAIAPDGLRYALIASGDLWYIDLGNDSRTKLTDTPEPESAPAWTGDGARITFTRGRDTLEVDPEAGFEALRFENASHLISSGTGRVSFVRDRALWTAGADGTGATELVPADANADVSIHSPRFSPSGRQILYLKTRLGLYGEVWRVETETGNNFPVIADRAAENPSSAEWLVDDTRLVYLTDRSGGLAVWFVDLQTSTLFPITTPLMGRALAPLGLDVHGSRVVLPRHTLSSRLSTSDGSVLTEGTGLQMEPAISSDGSRIAFTVAGEGTFEIRVMDRNTGEARYLGLGTSPRFSPDGSQIVYTRTALDGNRDIWKADTRTGLQEPLTDGGEIDDVPDWSPDGQTVVFASSRGGELALWAVPASGGRRQRLNDGGYAPRFSPDGSRIAYWHEEAIWTADADGRDPVRVADAGQLAPPAWGRAGPAFFSDGAIRLPDGRALPLSIWPEFDHAGEDNWLVARLNIDKAELWSLDLTFVGE